MGVYWGLVIAVNANPVVGTIITDLVTVAFMAIFYSLYPEEYREAGESIISVGDLLLKPADKLYEFDKQFGGATGIMLTALSGTIGLITNVLGTSNDAAILYIWALDMVSLFAMVPLIPALNYKDATVKKIVATGLLAFGSYGLATTTKAALGWAMRPHPPLEFLVGTLFFIFFGTMAGYGVLATIGYLHEG